jgi:hypothetical protein
MRLGLASDNIAQFPHRIVAVTQSMLMIGASNLESVVAEWLGRRTLNQRVVGSIPGEGTARYL